MLDGTRLTLLRHENVVYVLPRPGSVSPWSSKATDIAALCNLGAHVERIEKGTAFKLVRRLSMLSTWSNIRFSGFSTNTLKIEHSHAGYI